MIAKRQIVFLCSSLKTIYHFFIYHFSVAIQPQRFCPVELDLRAEGGDDGRGEAVGGVPGELRRGEGEYQDKDRFAIRLTGLRLH